MRVLLFGATGMVGSGVLIECLESPHVSHVTSVVRSTTSVRDSKLSELVAPDLFDLDSVRAQLHGHDACFFCVGVSSLGMDEADYTRLTYDLTISVASLLAELNPGMTFCYVTGLGTDSSEMGRSMWARVKGRTENQLLRMPLDAYMFRPGFIQPLKGVRSKTSWYQAVYAVTGPLIPFFRRVFPGTLTTTEAVGRAMIQVALDHPTTRVLETEDINRLAQTTA